MNVRKRSRPRVAVLFLCCAAFPGSAHDGPPYPILVDQPAGPVILSAWADPDVGTGTFHIYLEPPEGGALPERCNVRIHVQPATGRLPEQGYDAKPLRMNEARYHYVGEVQFDAAEDWRSRLAVRCGNEEGTAETVVAVTPPGQGPLLDFFLYLLPFAAVGFLIVRAMISRRRQPGAAP